MEANGYALIKLTTEQRQALTALIDSGLNFFVQDSEIKTEHQSTHPYMGFKPIGWSYSVSPERPDLAESFCFKDNCQIPDISSRNQQAANLYRDLEYCFNFMDEIARGIYNALSLEYSGESRELSRPDVIANSHIQINYTTNAMLHRDNIQDMHEDGVLFTLTKATAAGLRIQKGSTTYSPEVPTDNILCMPGDILEYMSGGSIRALHHSVDIYETSNKRISVMFFFSAIASSGKNLQPWRATTINSQINISERSRLNPIRFGLAPLE